MNFDKQLSKYFSKLGRKSAEARMKKISAKQRSEIASNAAKARWEKKKGRRNEPGEESSDLRQGFDSRADH